MPEPHPVYPIPDAAALIELLAGYLATELGRAQLARLRFETDAVVLAAWHQRLAQAQLWHQRQGAFPFSTLEQDPEPLLARAHDQLDGVELLQLLRFLDAAAGLREHAGESPDWPAISALASAIAPLPDLRQRLRRALLPDGSLDDGASPELARIRRQRARQRQVIEAQLEQHLRRLSGEGVLQDELITMRSERFVLPVRTEQRRRSPGIVHGSSSSGQTVFVEPLDTVELNNENIQLRDQELAEIHRILAELTAAVAAVAEPIRRGAAAAAVLELESAKARFAADYGGQPAEFGATLELVQARHPVLVASLRGKPQHPVVPLSLALGAPARVLVISGPNTGGKTVVLKTVAMAAWMAQCGLPVCAERARLPVFDSIWADVGDVQSLERNLSTFSSHLVHIREILQAATPRSLVLLDELGTATNAAEGAALAIEIAQALARRHAWTLISTHHDSLKAWAGAHSDQVVNGSVAVDPVTLAPSYQFRLGIPGISAGLDMAQRLGLPEDIIAGARSRLSREEQESATYLQKLQQNLADSEDRRVELDRRAFEVEQRERLLAERDRQQAERQMARLRADLERRLAAFTASAESQWRRSLESLSANLTSAQKRKIAVTVAQMKRETSEAFQAEVTSLVDDGSGAGPAGAAVKPVVGDMVRVRSLSRPAKVLRQIDADVFELEAGSVRMQIPLHEITAVVAAKPAAAVHVRTPEVEAVAEINLIGLRMEEAVEKLEKYLDQAILAATEQVRIVHGAGFGVLRKAVADVLRAHPQIASYSHPPQNQGGQGVTLAVLK